MVDHLSVLMLNTCCKPIIFEIKENVKLAHVPLLQLVLAGVRKFGYQVNILWIWCFFFLGIKLSY